MPLTILHRCGKLFDRRRDEAKAGVQVKVPVFKSFSHALYTVERDEFLSLIHLFPEE